MALELMNGSLNVDVFYDVRDKDYEDNICICLKESGPEDERVMYAEETNLYITPEAARELADMLMKAADMSSHATR